MHRAYVSIILTKDSNKHNLIRARGGGSWLLALGQV
jgi:hypothetical protein